MSTKHLKRAPRLFRRRAAGQSIPLIGLMIVVLVAMVGLSVDVGNTFAEERQIVAASNAASLAAMDTYINRTGVTTNRSVYDAIVSSLDSNGIEIDVDNPTELSLEAVYLDAQGKLIDTGSPVIEPNGATVPDNVAYIQVKLLGTVDTYFARVVNRNTLPVNATSHAGLCAPGNGVYPIAINSNTLSGDQFANPGAPQPGEDPVWWRVDSGPYAGKTKRRLFVGDGDVSGGFSWVRWQETTGAGGSPAASSTELGFSMAGDGNIASGFDEVTPWPETGLPEPDVYPEKPNELNGGDWVFGSAGNISAGTVSAALDAHIANDTRLIVPIYDVAFDSGADAKYRIVKMGLFVLDGYGVDTRDYVDLIYLGSADQQYTACTASPPPPLEETFELWGQVELYPEYQIIPEERKPVQYVVVLDVSGSMNTNFVGQGIRNGRVTQCANGPPGYPEAISCGQPQYAWNVQSERRIYVAKEAIRRLITLTNMPGNAEYNTQRPPDQMALVWYNSTQPSSWTYGFSDNVTTLRQKVLDANKQGGDPYKSAGGTNGAAGLYRSGLLLEDAPTTVNFAGEEWEYKRVVIFLTDGVSNHFLNPSKGNLAGGQSSSGTYPRGHYCRSLGGKVVENAQCQTTDVGGTYQGKDRPITQMVTTSQDFLQGNERIGAEVYVIALSSIPDTGLRYGVASTPRYHYSAETLEVYGDGTTNVDRIMADINTEVEYGLCQPGSDGEWRASVPPDHFQPVSGLTYPTVGEVFIDDSENGFTASAPVIADTAGNLTYRFTDIPRGNYELRAYLFYRHPLDPEGAQPRMYSLLYFNESVNSSMVVNVGSTGQDLGFTQSVRQDIALRLNGDVCAR
jgi:hypothetical protein